MPLSVTPGTRSDPFLFDFEADLGPDPHKPTTMQSFNVKEEHDQNSGRFMQQTEFNNFGMQNNHNFNAGSFGGAPFNANGIDPSELSMNNRNFLFNNGNALQGFSNQSGDMIGDDELLDTINLSGNGMNGFHPDMDSMLAASYGHSIHSPNMNNMFSHTPDDAPIQSPFVRNYPNASHLRQQIHPGPFTNGSPSSYNSPVVMSSGEASFDAYMSPKSIKTRKINARPDMERAASSKNQVPQTPSTPAVGNLSLNTDPHSMPIQNSHLGGHRHQKSFSGNWDNTPSSAYLDSPLSSPGPGNGGISMVETMLKSGKHASLPAKVDGAMTNAQQTQEAKRRRRRESHNMVERRRRDNINERIQELSYLVPSHRLEDEKVRKHLQNNNPLSPGLHGVSPPRATSMLAGGVGRRASGVGQPALTIPLDDKDKGPNKGDILNGAVGWTRDLMWSLYQKIHQEQEMQKQLEALGHPFHIEKTEEEKRMEAELVAAVKAFKQNSAAATFGPDLVYSRGPGSGLRVPGFTDIAGLPITAEQAEQGLGMTNPPFWQDLSYNMKEENEDDMEM